MLNIYTVFGNTRVKDFVEYMPSIDNHADALTFLKVTLVI